MPPFIPVLNEDCVAIILSFTDASSLINVACTSKSGKSVALPILVQTVALHTHRPLDIVQFCNSVLQNSLARRIRRLDILHDESTEFDSDLRDAVSGLIKVIALADNLTWLRICTSAETLFHHVPALLDIVLVHPPSHSLELIRVTDWDRLVRHQFAGLRNLSLGYTYDAADSVNLLAITNASAQSLESMHLEGAFGTLPFRFTEGYIPCLKLRMLSIAWTTLSLTDLTGLREAFPNVQFIRCYNTNIYPTQPGFSTGEPKTFSKLIGLIGELDTVMMFGALNRLRMLQIWQDSINTLSSFTRLTVALAGGSLCSLSLVVQLDAGDSPSNDDRIPAGHFFAEICRVAPRLKFLALTIDIIPGAPFLNIDRAAQQREAYTSHVRAVALPHLVNLDDLRWLFLKFELGSQETYRHGKAKFAVSILANLPRVEFFVLGPRRGREDHICLERPDTDATRAEGRNIVQLELDTEEVAVRLEQYQCEGSELEGVADWCSSIWSLACD